MSSERRQNVASKKFLDQGTEAEKEGNIVWQIHG